MDLERINAVDADDEPNDRLEDQVAVITGGANGLGASTARLFVENGARVFVADIADQDGERLCEELGPSATYCHCDVTNESDISGVVDLAMQKYGKLSIVHNNAGICLARDHIQDMDLGDFDNVYAVNVRSVVIGLKHAARVMIPSQKGSIITTCSVAGIMGGVGPAAYAFTKSAIPGITRQAAAELGKHGIRVNCISPSGTPNLAQLKRIRMIPGQEDLSFEKYCALMDQISELKGAEMRSEVFARSALFLASDDSSFTSGQNLILDGGFTSCKPFPLRVLTQTFDPQSKSN